MLARPGLSVVRTPISAQHALRGDLPEGAAVGNPLDLLAAASPEQFARAIDVVAGSGAVDAIVVLYVPSLVTDTEAVAVAVRAAADDAPIPVAAVFALAEAPRAIQGLPSFRFPRTLREPSGAPPATGRGAPRRRGVCPRSRSTTPPRRRSSLARSAADRDGLRPRRLRRSCTATASPSRVTSS